MWAIDGKRSPPPGKDGWILRSCKTSSAKKQNGTSSLCTALHETFVQEWNEILKEVNEGAKKHISGVTKAKEMSLKKTEMDRKAKPYRKNRRRGRLKISHHAWQVWDPWKPSSNQVWKSVWGQEEISKEEESRERVSTVYAFKGTFLREFSLIFLIWNTKTCGFKKMKDSDHTNCL